METNIDDLLTAVVVTHYSPKDAYGEMGPPSAGVVTETVNSAVDMLEGMEDSLFHVYHFRPPERDGPSNKYHRNLERFVDESQGVTLRSGRNRGLHRNILTVLDNVETPYIYLSEHDWKIVEQGNLRRILEVMEDFPKVKDVRFNKYKNRVEGWNTVVEPAPELPIEMCKVSSFTNQPHITRTDKLREWLLKYRPGAFEWFKSLTRDPNPEKMTLKYLFKIMYRKHVRKQPHVSKYDGAEYFLDTNIKKHIKQQGFRRAHERYGTYLYGPHNAGPYVEHLGR